LSPDEIVSVAIAWEPFGMYAACSVVTRVTVTRDDEVVVTKQFAREPEEGCVDVDLGQTTRAAPAGSFDAVVAMVRAPAYTKLADTLFPSHQISDGVWEVVIVTTNDGEQIKGGQMVGQFGPRAFRDVYQKIDQLSEG